VKRLAGLHVRRRQQCGRRLAWSCSAPSRSAWAPRSRAGPRQGEPGAVQAGAGQEAFARELLGAVQFQLGLLGRTACAARVRRARDVRLGGLVAAAASRELRSSTMEDITGSSTATASPAPRSPSRSVMRITREATGADTV
jgi:hypothetical protein